MVSGVPGCARRRPSTSATRSGENTLSPAAVEKHGLDLYLPIKKSHGEDPSTQATSEATEPVLRQSGAVRRGRPPVFKPVHRFPGPDRLSRIAFSNRRDRPRRGHRQHKNHSEEEVESIWVWCHVVLLAPDDCRKPHARQESRRRSVKPLTCRSAGASKFPGTMRPSGRGHGLAKLPPPNSGQCCSELLRLRSH